MTKEQMLRAMRTENQFRANYYYDMKLRKSTIEKAYYLFNNVSHTKGRKYLAESRSIKERKY